MKKRHESDPAPGGSGALRKYLYATAAATGAAILITEILGAKMLAPYVGTSHFVWTAQIGVTLVALSAGYVAGGWLADRSGRLAWMYGGILGAAAWLAGAALVCESIAFAALRFPLAVGSLLAAAALFFVPLALLAMVGPFCVRRLTQTVGEVGLTMGRLTGLSTLGSVAGTGLISYVLIPHFPNHITLIATAAFLAMLAIAYFLLWERRQKGAALTGATGTVLLIALAATQRPFASVPGFRELYRCNSNFGLMQVVETESGSRRFFFNDLLNQNGYEPARQRSASLFTYLLHGLARAYHPEIRSALCIGLGVGIVPMQLAREGAEVDVVEINPAVVPLAQKYFDFDPSRVRVHIADGRYYLHAATRKYDVVVLDAFLGESPPSHLMSREAFQSLQQRLEPGGLLVMNTFADFAPGRDYFAASLYKTLVSVFRSVRIHGASNGNVFYVASDDPALALRQPMDLKDLPPDIEWAAEQTVRSVVEPSPHRGEILTDRYNPVDFRDAPNREELRRRLALSYRSP
ncbi:MAG TPA: fused MFS/spermidine synthase [Verrucomicrobiota bacterium]|nr:fused MFS/spermidine synthase [Verrucomicrobiota bacterium]HNU49360.1 fused MFS/spermidine synthase [Verrucomicrobiota bacterium]